MTLLSTRRLLEEFNLTERILTEINIVPAAKGLLLSEGPELDATMIELPRSTRSRDGQPDPENAPD
jgi:IS5 family transposase